MADPQQIVQSTTSIPDYAKTYVEKMLGQLGTVADPTKPMPTYTGPRMAEFTDLQEGAMDAYKSPTAYMQGLGAFMSPYYQNVVDVQKREAARNAGMQAGALNARAAQMGAFGGSGVALQRAQQGRDLQQQLGDIQTRGTQAAFDTALQQMPQFLNQQFQMGTQQQQWQQKGLEQQYQDYLNELNNPYKQISFQSDILRGIPLSQGTQTMYQAPPSAVSQLTGLATAGLGAYGMYNMGAGARAPGAASGGSTEDIQRRAPAGLADLAIYNMA
jgi:hypothetical protein